MDKRVDSKGIQVSDLELIHLQGTQTNSTEQRVAQGLTVDLLQVFFMISVIVLP